MSDIQADALRQADADGEPFPRSLCADYARQLSTVQNWRGSVAILVQWLTIAIAALLAIWSGHWLGYLLAIIVIGTRQHALAIIAHDAAHYRLFTSRVVNDVVANLTLAYPLGISLSRYRPFHLDHHRFSYIDPERDPEKQYIQTDSKWQWPKSPGAALRIIVMDLLGLNIATLWGLLRQFSPWFIYFNSDVSGEYLKTGERILLSGFAVVVVSTIALTDSWVYFVLLWLLPLATVTTVVFRLRTIAEHSSLADDHELRSTRTVLPALFERLLIAPCNVNYHLEHHLYPSVPFYNLEKLHRRLLTQPEFRRNAHISKAYTDFKSGVIREVTRKG